MALTSFASPRILGWWPINVLVATEFALLTTELIDDNNLHSGKPSRTVSSGAADAFTGGRVIPMMLVLLVAWLVLSRLAWIQDIALPIIGVWVGILVIGLTMGAPSVYDFLLIDAGYLVFVSVVARLIFFPIRTIALIAAVLFLAGLLVPVVVAMTQ